MVEEPKDLKYEDLSDEPYIQNESGYTVRVVRKRSANEEFFAGFFSGAIWILLLLLIKDL